MTFTARDIEQLIQWQESFPDFARFLLPDCDEDTVYILNFTGPCLGIRSPVFTSIARDVVVAWVLWVAMFKPERKIMVGQANMRRPNLGRDHVVELWRRLPGPFRSELTRNSVVNLQFANDSLIFFRSASPDMARGMNVSHIVIDGLSTDSPRFKTTTTALRPHLMHGRSPVVILLPEEK